MCQIVVTIIMVTLRLGDHVKDTQVLLIMEKLFLRNVKVRSLTFV